MFESSIGLNKSNPWVVITTFYVLITSNEFLQGSSSHLREPNVRIYSSEMVIVYFFPFYLFSYTIRFRLILPNLISLFFASLLKF